MEKKKNNWLMWILLVFLPPIGIIYVWAIKKDFPQNKKIILSIVFALWFVFALANSENDTSDKEEKSKQASQPQIDNYVDINYLELYNNYKTYVDKFVKVSVKVTHVSSDGFNTDEGIDGLTSMITFELTDDQQSLKENDYVTVIGRVDDKILGYLYIKDTIIEETGDSAKNNYDKSQKQYKEKQNKAKEKAQKAEKKQQKKAAQKAKTDKETYIKDCKEYNYKDLLRDPDKYKGKKITLTIQISQKLNGGLFDKNTYYRGYTKGEYDIWMEDEYLISDCRVDDDTKLLDEDIITIYGEFAGIEELERALTGTKDEIPLIKVKYLTLNK